MIPALGKERVARAVLTYLAEPGDEVLAALLDARGAVDLVTAVHTGRLPTAGPVGSGAAGHRELAKLERAFQSWRNRLPGALSTMDLAGFHRAGIRLICPGDPEWPTQLDVLGAARPYALWLRGEADLRYCCLRSVSIVGARAATAYGSHVCAELAAALAERGWTVVSGGAYGIDGRAHQGALAADGVTVAVLACGVDYAYPPGHQDLFTGIAAQGLLVSEWPPGRTPTRRRFLIRNRVIGALSRGTVVVEAGHRSGALNTARHARDAGRPVMAVPGPVMSDMSAGCHKIIREWGAVCVTGARDVIELLSPIGEALTGNENPARETPAGSTDPAGEAPPGGRAPAGGAPAGDAAQAGGAPGGGAPGGGAPGGGAPGGGAPGGGAPGSRQGALARPAPAQPPLAQPTLTKPAAGAVLPRDSLDPATIEVLEAVPVRGAGPATIAVSAGLELDEVMRSLGLLAAGGFVERCPRGWRIRRPR